MLGTVACLLLIGLPSSTSGTWNDDPDITCPLLIVDRVEKNYLFNPRGEVVLTQYIAWEWWPEYREWHVAFWVMESKVKVTHGEKSTFMTAWRGDKLVRVRTPIYFETGTLDDPELADRQFLEKAKRRGHGGIWK